METEAAKLIAASLALLPILGVAIALGMIFSTYYDATARNPGALELLNKKFWIIFGVTEALAIFALGGFFMILFMF